MKLIVTAIYDSKIKEYGKCHFFRNRAEATREWLDAIKKDDSPFNRHPEDFTMFELGEYDMEQGKFTNLEAPFSLGTAHTLIN